MAFAFVQQAENSAAASGTSLAAPAVTYTSGNLLVVWTYWDGGDGGTFGVADGGSNAYTLIANKVSGGRWAVYYVENCTGGSLQPTMSWSAAVTNRAIYVAEYSGIATSGALISGAYDVEIAVAASGTDILISDNINVTTQPALMVGVARSESQEVVDVATGTGCTSRGTGWDFGSTDGARLQDKRITATGNATMAWTGVYGSQYKVGAVVTFAEATAGGSIVQRSMLLGVG
jgi:hypothetical protein